MTDRPTRMTDRPTRSTDSFSTDRLVRPTHMTDRPTRLTDRPTPSLERGRALGRRRRPHPSACSSWSARRSPRSRAMTCVYGSDARERRTPNAERERERERANERAREGNERRSRATDRPMGWSIDDDGCGVTSTRRACEMKTKRERNAN